VRVLLAIALALAVAIPASAGPLRPPSAMARRGPTAPPRAVPARPRGPSGRVLIRRERLRRAPLHRERHRLARQAIQNARVLVFDLDNTIVDTRPRTVAAVREFAQSRSLDRTTRARLAAVSKDDVGYDARETAAKLGLSRLQAQRFERMWNRRFWDPKSFALDEPVGNVIELIKTAKGKDVVFLSGRYESYMAATVAQLERLGLPTHNVILKPPGEATSAFKARVMRRLAGNGAKTVFVDDSARNRAAIDEARLPAATTIAVDFPVREPHAQERTLGPSLHPEL